MKLTSVGRIPGIKTHVLLRPTLDIGATSGHGCTSSFAHFLGFLLYDWKTYLSLQRSLGENERESDDFFGKMTFLEEGERS